MTKFEATPWSLIYTSWEPADQPLREALTTLGNGYFATRGAAEEAAAGGVHYPGTYLAGGYNRLESEVAGRVVENEDLVNWPNWLVLTFRPVNGQWFDLDAFDLLDFRLELDIRRGLLERQLRVADRQGRVTTLGYRRLVHMRQPHLAAIEWTITAENWSGEIEIQSALDGAVTNAGVERYRALEGRHLEVLDCQRVDEVGMLLVAGANQSRVRMAQVARTRVSVDGEPADCDRVTLQTPQRIEQRLRLECRRQTPLSVEKVVAVCTSRDFGISEPAVQARKLAFRAGSFDQLLDGHAHAWEGLWRRCDLTLDDGSQTQFGLRFHIFHLLQTASHNSVDLDVGIPARGWHGEAYRGHVFWDELFVFPFLNLRIPELTRELLMYRYRRLDEARWAAREAGFRGAMYPWQSGSDGREESQVVHLNPRSGRWVADDTHLQRHVNGAIAYNVWRYYEATGDREFLAAFGAEMILEIARFWASLARLNTQRQRYEIHGVAGPDEFHTRYPGAERPGLNNNAYTNVMAAWVLQCAGRAVQQLDDTGRQELLERLQLSAAELDEWDVISRRMFVPWHDQRIISQFEGYERLDEFDWDGYRERHGDIHRLDRILEAEGDSADRYKASKQADVLMLFFLFSAEELAELFQRLEYPFDPETIPANIQYYLHRTSHGSTLSRVVHAWVLARSDRDRSWGLFCDALRSDLDDVQGGTTAEGIHLGAMAGTVDLVQRCYPGLETRDDALWLNPRLPSDLPSLRLYVHYRGHWLRIEMNHRKVTVDCERGLALPASVGCAGVVRPIRAGERIEFPLEDGGAVAAAAAPE